MIRFLATAFAAALVASASPASADDRPSDASGDGALVPTPDARLATARGKYVPSSNAASGLAGNIVYFGLDMKTTWKVAGTTYTADMRAQFDLSDPSVPKLDISTLGTQAATPGTATVGMSNGATESTPGSIVGNVAGGANGFVQAIQIAGNANTVSNGASITVSNATPSFTVAPLGPSGDAACSACSFAQTPGNLGVTIAMPDGSSASQTLGANGVAQTAQITSNANAVANALRLTLGLRPGGSPSFTPALATGLLSPLPTVGIR